MYLDYYQLTKEPFYMTPDPDLLFLSADQGQALASIIDWVEHRKGFISIIGEVGVGKTTILRSYLEPSDKQVFKTIYIFEANVSFNEILNTIYQALGLVPETDDLLEMANHLHLILINEYEQGHLVVLVIYEAQNMTAETLENLRKLSALETSEDKLLQIVLVGQPELEENLNMWELTQINQRIVQRTHINPFSRRESVQYIQHRLAQAGRQDIAVFRKSALNYIIRHARGIPKVLNILCGDALVAGFGRREKRISARTAKKVIADFEGTIMEPFLSGRLLALLAVIFLAGYIFLISPFKDQVLSKSGQMTTARNPAPGSKPVENAVDPETVKAPPIKPGIQSPPQQPKPKPVKSNFPVKRVVKKGDTLYSLTRDVYGTANKELIERVKQQNKQINKDNKIVVGDKLSFPEPKKRN